MKYFIVTISLFCFTYLLNSQDSSFGKVSEEELASTQNSLFTEAPAVIMCQKNRTFINDNLNGYMEEVYVKIKIYDKDKAQSYLSKTEYLRKNKSDKEVLSSFRAFTYNLENGSMSKTKVDRKEIIEEDKSKYYSTHSFTFPNVKNGSVLEYKYTITSPFMTYIDEVYFQYGIPLIYSEYIFESPEFIKFSDLSTGHISPSSVKNESRKWNNDFNLNVKKTTYTNIPSLENKNFVINYDNIRPSIAYELEGVSIPGQMYKNYSQNWEGVFKSLRKNSFFGQQLNFIKYFKDQADQVTQGMTSDIEKANAILSYVQKNIKWNDYYGKYSENGVKSAFKAKSGNAADVNFIVINMLKAANIPSYPVLISTIGNGYINPSHPSINKFNYVLASFVIDGKVQLIDATSPYSQINLLPKRCLTLNGYLMTENSYKTVDILNTTASQYQEKIKAEISDKSIHGIFQKVENKYFTMEDVQQISKDSQKFEEDLMEDFNISYKDFGTKTEGGNLEISFDFDDTLDLEVLDDKILLNPMLFLKNDKQLFNEEKRTYNIEFGTPFKKTTTIAIQIPEGFSVEEIPEDVSVGLPNDKGLYLYNISLRDNVLRIKTILAINHAILPAQYYDYLKQLWSKIIETETQYISLVKS